MNKQDRAKITEQVSEYSDKISDALDADILLINADISRGLSDHLIDNLQTRKHRKNIILILITSGGDADAGYRIARFLQSSYDRYIAFVAGYCKSAGTLCVFGANEIIMCDVGELGPLDIQLIKKDELWEASSGLIAIQSLQVLQEKAFEMFQDYMLGIKISSENQITFKTATEIARKMAVGLLEPLYKQIDPIQVGEIARSMKIATAYGKRLMTKSKNYPDETLTILCETYPSHSFVIDNTEAKTLFYSVRPPDDDENGLRLLLKKLGYLEMGKTAIFKFLSKEIKGDTNEGDGEKDTTKNIEQATVQKTKRRRN